MQRMAARARYSEQGRTARTALLRLAAEACKPHLEPGSLFGHPARRPLAARERRLRVPLSPFQKPRPGDREADVFADARLEPAQKAVSGGDRASAHQAARDQQARWCGGLVFRK